MASGKGAVDTMIMNLSKTRMTQKGEEEERYEYCRPKLGEAGETDAGSTESGLMVHLFLVVFFISLRTSFYDNDGGAHRSQTKVAGICPRYMQYRRIPMTMP